MITINKVRLKLEDINKILELVKKNVNIINGDPVNIIEKNYNGKVITIDVDEPVVINNTVEICRTSIALHLIGEID